MSTSKLRYTNILTKDLTQASLGRMFLIMEQNYSSISRISFDKELENKQFIGVLKDTNNVIQGFTTYAINPLQLAMERAKARVDVAFHAALALDGPSYNA